MKYDFHKNKFIETDILSGKLAIAGSDGDIDWTTLKCKVEKLSAELKKLHIPIGHPVIIYGHKEYFFPLAILACIHSTIPYIPIDKVYPISRIKKIAEITGSQILINCSESILNVDLAVHININIESSVFRSPDFSDKIYGTIDDPLQYIMFTSGSTGEPKGVQITKNAALTFIDWVIKDYGFTGDDVFMNQAPFTFDISLYDILSTYALGATLVLNSEKLFKEQELFLKRISDYKCTIWNSTPSFVFLYLRNPEFKGENFPHIHTFLFIGEVLPNRTACILKENFKTARIFNAYGPTEATVATTLIEITEQIIKQYPSLPIGFSMPGSTLLIEKQLPEDKEGELIIVGDHVSIGYLKNETLNAQKFFIYEGKRAFKTGDLAYYENDMLFFIGRNDDQIKMHGFRIELSEINNVICSHLLVTDAVTVPLKRNNEVKKIVSFVKLKEFVAQNELKQQLIPFMENILPYYMIPGDIVIVNEFPYTISHKIDKNKLIEIYIFQQTNT